MQDNEQMIEKIRAFPGERISIAFHRRDHRLDRLLTEFFCCAGRRVKEGFGVGHGGVRMGPCRNDRGKIIESEACHGTFVRSWSIYLPLFSGVWHGTPAP